MCTGISTISSNTTTENNSSTTNSNNTCMVRPLTPRGGRRPDADSGPTGAGRGSAAAPPAIVCIYSCILSSLSLSIHTCVYIYIYAYMYTHVCVYIYIYIERERTPTLGHVSHPQTPAAPGSGPRPTEGACPERPTRRKPELGAPGTDRTRS